MVSLATKYPAPGARPLTANQAMVLDILERQASPLTAYQILDLLKRVRDVKPPTIYRALKSLIERGRVHRIEKLNAFVSCSLQCALPATRHDGQFLICADCGEVTELPMDPVVSAVTERAQSAGFRPSHVQIEVDGYCAHCAPPKPASQSRPLGGPQ